ncbi:MAG: TRAP transporter small permease subunit [Hyphomicrobiaceae bacterium]|nr:MAG: TRAP transporter small permease subunit [Hyphomicrobiaceae bacterium]
MKGLLKISRAIDGFNGWIGRMVAWAVLAAVLVSTANAIVRKVFDTSSNAWLEIQWILFGAVFLLCSAWTLIANEHIRIDIVNSLLPKAVRNWIDVFGHIFFLFPVCLVMALTSWPFFVRSLLQNEQSTNAGGLPVYPPKLLIPLAFTFLAIQAFSELIKRVAIMRGDLADTASGGGQHAAAEAEAERLLQAAREATLTAQPDTPGR